MICRLAISFSLEGNLEVYVSVYCISLIGTSVSFLTALIPTNRFQLIRLNMQEGLQEWPSFHVLTTSVARTAQRKYYLAGNLQKSLRLCFHLHSE